ncbi:penicillin-binding protein 2 [Steroidobacter sp. S1-65]|uniref:Peptidoglycan D,D-transpeptidase MrdA n=1 Tax=Steroidobacter gossypii TaxID=2805490 RepID=A0ABS1WUX6_9GAMM|nr:penicillin-binding protein 2 [Steroidobacter gossypii]MBM0104780.1 penicillin-binding protein 2 [Steroidobacter gossypii]
MSKSIRLKDHRAEQELFEGRALFAAVVMVLALGTVIARLVWLQVVRYDYYVGESQGNRIKVEPIPANRGLILDRNGLPLATNAPSFQLELTREQVADVDATLAQLAELELIESSDLPRLRKEIGSRRSFDSVPIKLQLTEQELARFAARRHHFPGVEVVPRLTRHYPMASSSVHAIGYVAAISEEDEKSLDMTRYAGTTLTGKSGVERAFESELHGYPGVRQLLVNARGRRVERIGREDVPLETRQPIAGNDLFLTIDQRVQQAAEEGLRGQRGAVVALDPSNGDVLAFVSTPAFDPNLFARGLTHAEYLALTGDPTRPMYDRALRGVYPPGSTVKPLFALAALEHGIVTPHDTLYCRGMWSSPGYGRARRDWKPAGHGTVDLRKALATSCDVYFFDIARVMGIDRMAGFLSQFGVGSPTGIDIQGERLGILPSTEWKKRAFKRPELQVWFPGDTISVGIGQGQMLVTPVQLAHAIATLSARGVRYQPRMVRAIRDVRTGRIRELPPVALPPVKLSDPAAWEVAIGGMMDVVNSSVGSAWYFLLPTPQYRMAGKSGTVQVFTVALTERVRKPGELQEHLRDHALFVAFAPVEAPKIAVAVIVENAPAGGSKFAAPIARRILDTYMLTPAQLAEQDAKRKPSRPALPAIGE